MAPNELIKIEVWKLAWWDLPWHLIRARTSGVITLALVRWAHGFLDAPQTLADWFGRGRSILDKLGESRVRWLRRAEWETHERSGDHRRYSLVALKKGLSCLDFQRIEGFCKVYLWNHQQYDYVLQLSHHYFGCYPNKNHYHWSSFLKPLILFDFWFWSHKYWGL